MRSKFFSNCGHQLKSAKVNEISSGLFEFFVFMFAGLFSFYGLGFLNIHTPHKLMQLWQMKLHLSVSVPTPKILEVETWRQTYSEPGRNGLEVSGL